MLEAVFIFEFLSTFIKLTFGLLSILFASMKLILISFFSEEFSFDDFKTIELNIFFLSILFLNLH